MIILLFIFGLIIGSFLNCLIYRLALPNFSLKGLGGRSYCPDCKHVLAWQDLIPVLSFVFLRGRCRYCQKQISIQYPLVELATALIFVSCFMLQASNLVYLLFISSCLIAIFVFDLKHYIIPDEIVYPAILVSCIWYLVSSIIFDSYTKYEILNTIYSAFSAALFFLSIYLVTKGRGLGFGDVKLAFLMGLVLGFPKILAALFFAFLVGAILGAVLILAKKKELKSELPFAPFLISGVFFALFFGQTAIDSYLGFLLS